MHGRLNIGRLRFCEKIVYNEMLLINKFINNCSNSLLYICYLFRSKYRTDVSTYIHFVPSVSVMYEDCQHVNEGRYLFFRITVDIPFKRLNSYVERRYYKYESATVNNRLGSEINCARYILSLSEPVKDHGT